MTKYEFYCLTLLKEEQNAQENLLYLRHLLEHFSVASYVDKITSTNTFDRDFVVSKVMKMIGFRIKEYLDAKLYLLDITRRWKEASLNIEVKDND